MRLSIVTTLFCSASQVEPFYQRSRRAAEKLTADYEIVFVNDGSPDDSLDRVVALQRSDPKVRVIDLSRNFGQHRALMAGLTHATGDLVFMLDSDLEEDPDWLLTFHETFQREASDVVFGVQTIRKGVWSERFSGALFYWIFNLLSPVRLTPNAVTARLMSRRYVASLLKFQERTIFLAGLMVLTGYRQVALPVVKQAKPTTTYSPGRKLTLLLDAITSFTDRPLIYIFGVGALISTMAALYILYLLFCRFWFNIPVAGWSSLIVSIWFLGGMTILFIGILGIYLSRIYMETKERPSVIVKQVYGKDPVQ